MLDNVFDDTDLVLFSEVPRLLSFSRLHLSKLYEKGFIDVVEVDGVAYMTVDDVFALRDEIKSSSEGFREGLLNSDKVHRAAVDEIIDLLDD